MLLEIKDLTIEFHDHLVPETVVKSVNLVVDKGEIVGIVGESGSGKSMTALTVAGLLPRKDLKKSGEIWFEKKELLTMPRKELRTLQGDEISIIFQEPMTALNPTMKIGKQVEESLYLHTDLDKDERKKRAIKWLEQVELKEAECVYESYPHELSGGMRQRVMIAAAMVSKPQLLIADEPTTALDVTVQAQIIKLLKKINEKNKTAILFISHDLGLVKELCDRVYVMKDGEVIEKGNSHEVFYHPKENYTKQLVAAIPKINMSKEEKGEKV